MLRAKLALFLALLLMNGSLASGESDSGRSTGVEGVVMVSPIRPGPIKKGSDVPTRGPLPNAVFSVANEKGTVTSFTTDGEGRFRLSLAQGTTLCRWRNTAFLARVARLRSTLSRAK
jgi:hypothetical protein